MAVDIGSEKIKKYTWGMNEIGRDNYTAGMTCTEYSSKGDIQTCITKLKETKEQKRNEDLKQRMDEFREDFGKGKVGEVINIKEQQARETEEKDR